MAINYAAAWETIQRMINDFIALLPNLVLAAMAFSLFYFASKWIHASVRAFIRKRMHRHNLDVVLSRLAEWLVLLLGGLISLVILIPTFHPRDLIALVGVGGIAIGLAFREILQNFFSGILLLLTAPFHVDDVISVNNMEGTVEEIETRATIIRTANHRRIVIPNTSLFNNAVTVLTAHPAVRWEQEVSIPWDQDPQDAKDRILNVIRTVNEVLQDPPPRVYITKFDDSGTTIHMLPSKDTPSAAQQLPGPNLKLKVYWWTPPKGVNTAAITDVILTGVREALIQSPPKSDDHTQIV